MSPETPSPKASSLWTALHDSRIVEITSDRLSRTVAIVVISPHLARHRGLPESTRLRLLLHRVRSVHAATFQHWPGDCESQVGKTWAEKQSIVDAYQAKGREESVAWDEMERKAATTGDLHILQAEATQDADLLTLALSGHTSDEWFGIKVVASVFTIEGTDGFPLDLEGVVALGEEYWRALGNAP